ncbi:MAG: hypothetical protein GF308_04270 [Candidatus Heimdallarchaeota archaeon]|nr:hypothetical protein [Candidatus Heimdallarchaeota archaeon]
MKKITDLPINLKTTEIIHLLGGGGVTIKKSPPQRMLNDIQRLKKLALSLIQPQAIYEKIPSTQLSPKRLFNRSEITYLSVCTIGKKLEERCKELMIEGKMALSVTLDAIASVAAEEVAKATNKIILEEMKRTHPRLNYTHRFSPGYCTWPLGEGQEMIFNLLPTKCIGVELNESMMMVPRKSVSFAINFGEEIDKMLGLRICEECEIKDCPFRRRPKKE